MGSSSLKEISAESLLFLCFVSEHSQPGLSGVLGELVLCCHLVSILQGHCSEEAGSASNLTFLPVRELLLLLKVRVNQTDLPPAPSPVHVCVCDSAVTSIPMP